MLTFQKAVENKKISISPKLLYTYKDSQLFDRSMLELK